MLLFWALVWLGEALGEAEPLHGMSPRGRQAPIFLLVTEVWEVPALATALGLCRRVIKVRDSIQSRPGQ